MVVMYVNSKSISVFCGVESRCDRCCVKCKFVSARFKAAGASLGLANWPAGHLQLRRPGSRAACPPLLQLRFRILGRRGGRGNKGLFISYSDKRPFVIFELMKHLSSAGNSPSFACGNNIRYEAPITTRRSSWQADDSETYLRRQRNRSPT